MSVSTEQRFTPRNPCPICGGYQSLPQGKGIRCGGYLSEDGAYAHCTRDDGKGRLLVENGDTYSHFLNGNCECGTSHREIPISTNGHGTKLIEEAVYQYRNADGSPAFEVIRYRQADGGKTFRQRHGPPSAYVWKCPEELRVLYRLPDLLASSTDEPVFICEGEKDADALVAWNLVATTNPLGAGVGKWLPKYTATLRDRWCILLPDNDNIGRKHMQTVAAAIHGTAQRVQIVELPGLGESEDVSDWISKNHTIEDLAALIDETPTYAPPLEKGKPEYRPAEPSSIYSNLRKEMTEPPRYILHVGDFDVHLPDFRSLFDHKKIRLLCGEQYNWIPDPLKPAAWERQLRSLLDEIQEVGVPEDATDSGLLWQYILAYLDRRFDDGSVPVNNATEYNSWIYFRGKDLAHELRQVMQPRPRAADVWAAVRAHGGVSETRRFGSEVLRVWGIPASIMEGQDEA